MIAQTTAMDNLLGAPTNFYQVARTGAIGAEQEGETASVIEAIAEALPSPPPKTNILGMAERFKFVPRAALHKAIDRIAEDRRHPRITTDRVEAARDLFCYRERRGFLEACASVEYSDLVLLDDTFDFLPTDFQNLALDATKIEEREVEYIQMLIAQQDDNSLEDLSFPDIHTEMSRLASEVQDLDIPAYRAMIEKIRSEYPGHHLVLLHRGAMGLDLALQAAGLATIGINISTALYHSSYLFQTTISYLAQQGLTDELLFDPAQKFLVIDNGLQGSIIHSVLQMISIHLLAQGKYFDIEAFTSRFSGLLTFGIAEAYYPYLFLCPTWIFGDHRRKAVIIEEERHHTQQVATHLAPWNNRIYPIHMRNPRSLTVFYGGPNRTTQRQKLLSWRWKVEVIRAFLPTDYAFGYTQNK